MLMKIITKLIIVTGKGLHSKMKKSLCFKRFRNFKIFCSRIYKRNNELTSKIIEITRC